MTTEALSALNDDQAILLAERAELVDFVFTAAAAFGTGLEAADAAIARWLERAEEVKARADVAGVPFVVKPLPRLTALRRPVDEAVATLRGRES